MYTSFGFVMFGVVQLLSLSRFGVRLITKVWTDMLYTSRARERVAGGRYIMFYMRVVVLSTSRRTITVRYRKKIGRIIDRNVCYFLLLHTHRLMMMITMDHRIML